MSTVQRVKRLKIHNHSNKLLILRSSQKGVCNSGLKAKTLPLNAVKYGNVQSHNL